MHTCPMVTALVPHVGGPILPPACPTVIIGGMPAARVGDMAVCTGPPDIIAMGSPTVMIGGMMSARMGDMTAHGGVIVTGFPTVMIGIPGGTIGNPTRAAMFFPGQQQNKDTCAVMSTEGVVHQSTGTPIPEPAMQVIATGSGAYTSCNGTTDESAVMTAAGIPATEYQNPSLNDIAQAVREGRAVLVGLDARAIWPAGGPNPIGHAVRVTGVDVDGKGNITAFHINDTGTGRANQVVPAATMQTALNQWGGGRMATSDNPVP
jgi:uncharacterized Zn-binding protein involved in type VI secretion